MRGSHRHWTQLSELLLSFERCFESCARLDAYRLAGPGAYPFSPTRAHVEHRLACLTRRIEHQLDKVTAERLIAELTVRMAADAAKKGERAA